MANEERTIAVGNNFIMVDKHGRRLPIRLYYEMNVALLSLLVDGRRHRIKVEKPGSEDREGGQHDPG